MLYLFALRFEDFSIEQRYILPHFPKPTFTPSFLYY